MNHKHISIFRYVERYMIYNTETDSVYIVAFNTSVSFSCEKYQFSKSAIPPNIVHSIFFLFDYNHILNTLKHSLE